MAAPQEAEPTQHALVIDDDGAFRAFVREVFEAAGWHVCETGAVEEALMLVRAVRFDLVVTDYRLGAVSGLELMHRIRARDLLLPVVLMSSALPPTEAQEALRHDAFLLDKSTLVDELPALLSAMA